MENRETKIERLTQFAKYMFRCGEESFSHRREQATNQEIEVELQYAIHKFHEEVVVPAEAKKLESESKIN